MNRVLVTGGAGFLGSHLCEHLLGKGSDVVCIDNFFSGHKDNIRPLLAHPYFEFIRHDVIHPLFIEVDRIFHLACPASPIHYQHNPIKTVKTNVMGTINMLGLAKRIKCRILLASTSEVYGDAQVHPQTETYWGNVNPIGVRSCYDEGKRVAETLMMDYHRQNKVDIRIARIFNTYGPRMAIDDGRVVSNFIVQALRGEPITVYGDGSQTRSFCYVSDLDRRALPDDGRGGLHRPGQPRESRANSRSPSSPRKSSSSPRANPISSSSPCPPTTRSAAGRISPWPETSSAGSPRSPWKKGWPGPSNISGRNSGCGIEV